MQRLRDLVSGQTLVHTVTYLVSGQGKPWYTPSQHRKVRRLRDLVSGQGKPWYTQSQHRKVQRLKRFRDLVVIGRCRDSRYLVDKENLGTHRHGIGRCGDSEIWSVDKENLGTHRHSIGRCRDSRDLVSGQGKPWYTQSQHRKVRRLRPSQHLVSGQGKPWYTQSQHRKVRRLRDLVSGQGKPWYTPSQHRKVQRLKRFGQWTRETLVHTVTA